MRYGIPGPEHPCVVWESILLVIVAKGNLGSPITKAIFNGAMYVPSRFLRSSKQLPFVECESCHWRPTAYPIEWALLLAEIPRFFDYRTGHCYMMLFHLHRLRNDILQDVCHPSTWANEIPIRRSSSPCHRNQGTQSAHSLCKVSYAIDSDAGDGSNREKFGRKDPRLSVYPKFDLASQGGQV